MMTTLEATREDAARGKDVSQTHTEERKQETSSRPSKPPHINVAGNPRGHSTKINDDTALDKKH